MNYFGNTAVLVGLFFVVSACANSELSPQNNEEITSGYTEPETAGLVAGNPFPNSGDVCVSLKNNEVTKPLEDAGHILIACPAHEKGAIEDRINEQDAEVALDMESWLVMRVPHR